MKMTYALLMGCLPLGLLTIGSFLPAGQIQQAAPPPMVNVNALGALAKQQQVEAGKAVEYLQRLEKADLLSARDLPPDVSLPEPHSPDGQKWFGAVHQSWSNAQTAHDGAVAFMALFHPKPISEKRKRLAELEKFAARTSNRNPFADVPGGSALMDYVTSLCDKIKPQIEAEDHLSKAEEFSEQKNYDGCLDELKLIKREKLDPLELADLVKLQRKAEFKKYWKIEPPESDIEKRRKFLQSSPPAVLDDEKATIEKMERALALAECQQEFKLLRDQPPAQARDYLRRAAALVQNKAAPADFRLTLRMQFVKWVTSKLPVREALVGATIVMETKRKNGTPIAGVFKDAGDKSSKWYKYWVSLSEFKKVGETKYDQIYLARQLDGEPQQPLCKRHAEAFNEGRKKLLAHWESADEWRMFAALCQQLQRDWKQYQDQGCLAEFERAAEMKARDLEIEAALALANELLGEWSSVAALNGE